MIRALGRSGLICIALVTVSTVQAAERPIAAVTQLALAPEIDGVIGDGEWQGVPVGDRPFIQVVPEFGEPSPFRTVVRIAQTEDALYVAIEAFDLDPDRLSVAATSRDGAMDRDDSVAVMVDTFSDRRTGYVFRTNALATQWDARLADNGRTVDALWDAEWRCAAQRYDDRWTAEFEIPFVILRFRAGDNETWGLSFLRNLPRRLETSVWSGPSEAEWRVSSFGTLTGLQLQGSGGKTWLAIPYGLAGVNDEGETDFEVGGDFRWRPSSALGVDLTVNPDFALIEADVEVINLTRFEFSFPKSARSSSKATSATASVFGSSTAAASATSPGAARPQARPARWSTAPSPRRRIGSSTMLGQPRGPTMASRVFSTVCRVAQMLVSSVQAAA